MTQSTDVTLYYKVRRKLNRILTRVLKKTGVVKNANRTVYHCCIQKSASSWFVNFFNDPSFLLVSGLPIYRPGINFIPDDEKNLLLLDEFPSQKLITPLYITYDKFQRIDLKKEDRVFFVMRDPRDLVISDYFSIKFSHGANPYIIKKRKELLAISEEEGIQERIENFNTYLDCLASWTKSKDPRVMLVKYEDLFVYKQEETFTKLFKHLEIPIDQTKLKSLLQKYTFKKISGREKGKEDTKSHYRSGTHGDWEKYFNQNHKDSFKNIAGQLIIDLGYEKDLNW